MRRIIALILGFLLSWDVYAWNALGHQLVAQIAYDHLTPKAKQMCDEYTHFPGLFSPNPHFIADSTWLDRLRGNDVHWFDNLHYISIPFARDQTPLPAIPEINALWGIKQALAVLSSSKSRAVDKRLSLRILIHLVGDIHQPLHAGTKVSKRFPNGDLGGNLFRLAKNNIGINLHQYWDNGGGILLGQSKNFQVRNKALQLEEKWPCSLANHEKKPLQWIKASHQLALTQVYTLAPYKIPSKKYQLNAQNITEKQILLAGCRLATLLNTVATSSRTQ